MQKERHQTTLDESNLKTIMLNLQEKINDQTISEDGQILTTLINDLRPHFSGAGNE
ncbi:MULTISPECIES: hypothetical protein [Pontibacillus]|uniref:Uncharacterized protein n=1 Tax=Pontibacillus chungwhensis TaxID=265426 RepID=A0ABY8V465_9BACI|nr:MULTISPECIES: hypothetical protein [Pontibacillus]MCD5324303.1 hypothetical protein [Pontibacillus sp. HN14]WIF99400.1 hypothetical protein QNI29_07005 [Pontibacillus chungwhensis]